MNIKQLNIAIFCGIFCQKKESFFPREIVMHCSERAREVQRSSSLTQSQFILNSAFLGTLTTLVLPSRFVVVLVHVLGSELQSWEVLQGTFQGERPGLFKCLARYFDVERSNAARQNSIPAPNPKHLQCYKTIFRHTIYTQTPAGQHVSKHY